MSSGAAAAGSSQWCCSAASSALEPSSRRDVYTATTLRRLNTALDTLRKNLKQKSNEQVAGDDILLKTLENVVSAKKSYMHLRDRCPWRPGEQSER